jgi:hypothetical protein
MPRHDWFCPDCGDTVKDLFFRLAEMPDSVPCMTCGGKMEIDFSHCTTKPEVFEPFYCEAFDCDVNSPREWKAILKDKGVIEAGDKVGGARNDEWESKNANAMVKQPPKGREYVPEQVRQEEFRRERASWDVETVD